MQVRYILIIGLLFLVSACGGDGGGTTPPEDKTIPSAPTEVTATPSPGYITISWTDNSDNETGFTVYRDTATSGLKAQAMQKIGEVGQDQTSYVDSDVNEGVSYTYAVTAKGAGGESGQVNQTGDPVTPEPETEPSEVEVSVTPTSAELEPGDTQTFTATVTGSDNTTVSWSSTGGTINADGVFTAPDEAGDYTVTATSQADPRAKGTATVTVKEKSNPGPDPGPDPEPENNPPTISSFTVTPTEGQAPLEVTFSWEVADADGDTIRCALYIDDGYLEELGEHDGPAYSISDCGNTTSQTHTYTTKGNYKPEIFVYDDNMEFATPEDGWIDADTEQIDVAVSGPVITVTNTNDSGAGSLRQAVLDAADGTEINFAESVRGKITLLSQIVITKNVTISGPGVDELTLSGNNTNRVFVIAPNITTTIQGLTATEGFISGDLDNDGGAIQISPQAVVTLKDCVITNSSASDLGGAIQLEQATLNIDGCTVSNSTAEASGGGIYSLKSVVSIKNSTISGNTGAPGGGLWLEEGSLEVEKVNFVSNISQGSGGGIHLSKTDTTLIDVTISGNSASSSGGGLYQSQTTTTIEASSVSSNSSNSYGGGISSGGSLTVENSIIQNNAVTGACCLNSGGGISAGGVLVVRNSSIVENNAPRTGGGVLASGETTIVRTTIRGNSSPAGGGIYSSANLTIAESSIFENTATNNGGGIYSDSFGDGISITNSTVVNNVANTGGGVYSSRRRVTLRSSTVTLNQGNGISSREVTLNASIVAANAGGDFTNLSSAITSLGYNLVGNGTDTGLTNGINNDLVGSSAAPLDPGLNALADNGGPTRTMSLKADSSANDHIPASFCPTSTDQRGEPRPGGDDTCDIGAFEAQ